MKIGRNDPCPCGSGRKYKKCCEPRLKTRPLAAEHDSGGQLIGRPFIETEFQGQRMRAVGSELHRRPLEETDQEFYVYLLVQSLGVEWVKPQLARPASDRHVLGDWLGNWQAARRQASEAQPGQRLYDTAATGTLTALLCIAFDVYSVRHAMKMPESLLKRLRNPDQFQGARYELAIAAVFARAGYELEWLSDSDRKLPEFIAHHSESKIEIAVEAKSRHRPGVLGRAGPRPPAEELEPDVARLMRDALKKETGARPFVVCLDLNLPTQDASTFEQRGTELHERVLQPFWGNDETSSAPFSAAFLTNYSWHWDGEDPAGDPMSFVAVPGKPHIWLPENERELLSTALFQYGSIPESAPFRESPSRV
jgi:hypothetical protein